jgi:hypothetical protein
MQHLSGPFGGRSFRLLQKKEGRCTKLDIDCGKRAIPYCFSHLNGIEIYELGWRSPILAEGCPAVC